MERYLKPALLKDLYKKILLVTGPRQVGKTTLAKSLLKDIDYYNYDLVKDRKLIHRDQLNFSQRSVILDELHKMKNWKRWLKGNYDTRTDHHAILVTGSARLDVYKKMGDSLAGRFFQYRLLPLDIKELMAFTDISPHQAMEQILELSGFPEPFLSQSKSDYKRWQNSHLDIILKQDLPEIEHIRSIRSVELLVELMTERAGNVISYNSLREDLHTDDKSVQRWFNSLENSYVLFKITPYSKKINRAVTKLPKYYFFDIPRVVSPGPRFENFVALSIYKEILFRQDTLGENYELHYLRDSNKNEVDFLICKGKTPFLMVECKLSDRDHSTSFSIFEKALGNIPKIILVKNVKKPYTLKDGTKVLEASNWLSKMPF